MYQIESYQEYPTIDTIFSLIREEADVAFLDSSLQNELGRYSVIGRNPYLKLVQGDNFTVNGMPCEETLEAYVKRYLKEHREENPFPEMPLVSGAIGYFSYDYGRKKEGVETRHKRDVTVPDAVLVFYDDFIIEDHQSHRLYLVANDHQQDAAAGLQALKNLVQRAAQQAATRSALAVKSGTVAANFTKDGYLSAVRHMMDYIVEGDIYIANMTQQLQIVSEMHPYDLFCALRSRNPSPFGGYLQYSDFQIVSASPERFLEMRNRKVQTCPIKGTRKRGATLGEDEALRRELEQSDKDRSELLMIVDLERNDLNRVCIPGSVTVSELFAVEAYATVFHLVANVTGELQPDLDVMDLLQAAFPGGSITGAPKLRAMEIIDELEHDRRNIYTGSMGYLSLSGDCDLNIMIRTVLHQDGTYYLGVGGGITCESEPVFEYAETLQKAKALLQALGADFQGEAVAGGGKNSENHAG